MMTDIKHLSIAVVITLIGMAPHGTQSAERPNILLILTDDQGWGDVASHGNEKLDTPNMDRLAAQGARFERFFVSSICAPTRASLLTGRYHLRTGVSWIAHRQEVMRYEELTLAELCREAGYATGCFGKWHNGIQTPNDPNGQGFDEFVGMLGGGCTEYFDCRELYRNRLPWRPDSKLGYITDVITDEAVDFMVRHRDSPWLCYVPYNAPHTPCQVPDRYFDKYRARGLDEMTASIYGMVENIDDNLGRLLDALEEVGQAEDTIVVFLSDNGPEGQRYNGGMRGTKGTLHEGGTRVPCFIRYPGNIKAGTTVALPCAHIDLLPTLADFCGLESPAARPLDGASLAGLLTGAVEELPARSLFFHKLRQDLAAVRTPRWRAVGSRGSWQLFDMLADPLQENDLAAKHPVVLADLVANHTRWQADVTKHLIERTPVPVGHPAAPMTELRTPESFQEGKLKWPNGPGTTTEWLRNWRSTGDRIWWDLDVLREGTYEVSLVYACSPENVGSILRIECGDKRLEATIDHPFEGNVRRRPDCRSTANWLLCDFTSRPLGKMSLPSGRQVLSIQATKIAAGAVCEFRGLILKKVD